MPSKISLPEKIELRKKFPPTYGRRSARSLTEMQSHLLKNLYPQIKIEAEKSSIDKLMKESKGKKIFFEIGFGDGEHLVHVAKNNPDAIVIGSEVYKNSFVVCLQKIHKENIQNIRLLFDDSRFLLEKLPPQSLDKVYILFPDPWPKRKQFKRRIVNKQTLGLIHPLMRSKGVIRLGTDIDSYFDQMISVFAEDKRFKLVTKEKDFAKIPDGHTETRYQQKAIREGRLPRFLEYTA